MKKKLQDVRISARIPSSLKQLMEAFIARDAHLNKSDLIRDAIREKIQREAPELYKRLFLECQNERRLKETTNVVQQNAQPSKQPRRRPVDG
ncbi:MAG: ribbon-helix-helix domain-containing protein [Candidatus Bathyarchaeota archaeon]|nr:ribbon-helix-helix domain-containing protein [Candidatus Bathyarchaeota archaeon]